MMLIYACAPSLRISRNERSAWDDVLRVTANKYRTFPANNLIYHIRMYLGTPYRAGGTSTSGMDCSGFVMTVFRVAFGIDLPHNSAMIYNSTTPIPIEKIQCGDLLFFESIEGKRITHIGIYLTDTHFAHASSTHGVTISSFRDEYYRKRFKGVNRVVNIRFDEIQSLEGS